jgi:hypothetical protein
MLVLLVLLVVVAAVVVVRVLDARRARRRVKIWLEVASDAQTEAILPTLVRLARRYEGQTTLIVYPMGCRYTEGKRLMLGWGFKPCPDLMAALRELGSVTLGT